MRKEKENAINDFLKSTEKVWTWEKLTDNEKKTFKELINKTQIVKIAVKGSYENRWFILNALYYAYLLGCGYNGAFWRI